MSTEINALSAKLLYNLGQAGNYPTAIEGLTLYRRDQVNSIEKCVYKPLIALVVHGQKEISVGKNQYHCANNNLLMVGVDVPATTIITQTPCVSMVLDINKQILDELMAVVPQTIPPKVANPSGVLLQPISQEILNAFSRMVALLDHPEEIPALAPIILKEIYYRLLSGPNGYYLRSFFMDGWNNNNIARSINWLKANLTTKILIDDLATQVNMSTSNFYRKFKELTSLSPIQFQKRLRLQQARQLMLVHDLKASQASLQSGYENFGQFSREYKRLFGEAPHRDIAKLKHKD